MCGPIDVPVTKNMRKRGKREKMKLTIADIMTERGKIAFGMKTFFIRLLLPNRLNIEAEVLCEKKFQRMIKASAFIGLVFQDCCWQDLWCTA